MHFSITSIFISSELHCKTVATFGYVEKKSVCTMYPILAVRRLHRTPTAATAVRFIVCASICPLKKHIHTFIYNSKCNRPNQQHHSISSSTQHSTAHGTTVTNNEYIHHQTNSTQHHSSNGCRTNEKEMSVISCSAIAATTAKEIENERNVQSAAAEFEAIR